jgi:hypothetical protein
MGGSIPFQIPGNIDDHNAAVAAHQQDSLEQFGAAAGV